METFPQKILVAADGSSDSVLALQMAGLLAEKIDVELHVVYVALLSPWILTGTLSDKEFQKLKQQQQRVLDEQVKTVEKSGGEVAEAHFRTGNRADEEVVKLAREIEAEMIIVGSRGRRSFDQALVGRDSDGIVRYAPCPVLVARPAGRPKPKSPGSKKARNPRRAKPRQ